MKKNTKVSKGKIQKFIKKFENIPVLGDKEVEKEKSEKVKDKTKKIIVLDDKDYEKEKNKLVDEDENLTVKEKETIKTHPDIHCFLCNADIKKKNYLYHANTKKHIIRDLNKNWEDLNKCNNEDEKKILKECIMVNIARLKKTYKD